MNALTCERDIALHKIRSSIIFVESAFSYFILSFFFFNGPYSSLWNLIFLISPSLFFPSWSYSFSWNLFFLLISFSLCFFFNGSYSILWTLLFLISSFLFFSYWPYSISWNLLFLIFTSQPVLPSHFLFLFILLKFALLSFFFIF